MVGKGNVVSRNEMGMDKGNLVPNKVGRMATANMWPVRPLSIQEAIAPRNTSSPSVSQ
jgi:hypothetical protein